MQLQNSSDMNFGAFISPSSKDMVYFKRYLAKKTGKIDTAALGKFVINQAKNDNADICYKHFLDGDVLEVFLNHSPEKSVKIPCGKTDSSILNKGFMQKLKQFYKDKTEKFVYDPIGSWDNLPKELKEAGKIADKMEKNPKIFFSDLNK